MTSAKSNEDEPSQVKDSSKDTPGGASTPEVNDMGSSGPSVNLGFCCMQVVQEQVI